jgi:dTDP-4-dehydrorhamnose reductase
VGNLVALGRQDADVTDPAALEAAVRRAAPDAIVNATAYTAVDRAETDRDTAYRVNAEAVDVLARLAARQDAWLVHYSTDYVFDGTSSAPYRGERSGGAPERLRREQAGGRSGRAREAAAATCSCGRAGCTAPTAGASCVRF